MYKKLEISYSCLSYSNHNIKILNNKDDTNVASCNCENFECPMLLRGPMYGGSIKNFRASGLGPKSLKVVLLESL